MNIRAGWKHICTSSLIVHLLLAQYSFAADEQGQYAIRGAGLIKCALYVQERQYRGDVYLITGSWIDGYITGINQYDQETYDVLSFESTELLTEILDKHCRKNPEHLVFSVLNSLFKELRNDRISERSGKEFITQEGHSVSLYEEVIRRVQTKLKNAGHYKGEITGRYDQQTIDGIKAFQQSIAYKTSGFPDQMTLWRLLRM